MKRIIIWELGFFSRYLIRRFRPYIIGVTGSSGKTTTKYFVSALIVACNKEVLVSPGNLNSEFGLPMAILGFGQAPRNILGWLAIFLYSPIKALLTFRFEKYLVLEYAADHAGDIDRLTQIAQPDIAIITSIGSAHLGKIGSLKKIAKEKWKLALAAKEAVIILRQTAEKLKIYDLAKTKADLFILPSIKYAKAENIIEQSNKTSFDLYIANKKYDCSFKFFGKHNIADLELAAFASHLVCAEGRNIAAIVNKLTPLSGSGRRFLTNDEILVIDESYNANPESMKAALENLRKIKYGRKVAVLGQMSELGEQTKTAHKEIAELAKNICDETIGIGEEFHDLGLDRWYQDVSELILNADQLFKKSDVVLVKGSRWANRLEKLTNYLENK